MNGIEAFLDRGETRLDQVDPGHAARWLATLDRAAPGDDSMPQGFHWCLCLPDAPTARLGEDGHRRRSDDPEGLLPPLPQLPRRMWASSKIEFSAPVRLGMRIERHSRVRAIEAKTGSSGELVFVTLAHETHGDGRILLREEQALVYLAAASPDAPLVPPPPGPTGFDPSGWDRQRTLVPGETLLMRFSALSFNAHRIHYDLPYARMAERYRGLVVHGPLVATMLLQLAQAELGDNALSAFSFRALSPAICGETLHLAMRRDEAGWRLGAFASDGREIASAAAR